MASPVKRLLRPIDIAQQKIPFIAFPYAVVKKFGDDKASMLAALIAYYGFLSLFPLLQAGRRRRLRGRAVRGDRGRWG